MANSGRRQSADDVDRADHLSDSEDMVNVSTSSSVTRRLRAIIVEEGDGDLLMQRSDREEDGCVLQWLRALDMQVMGACRADERLKPLLKMNNGSSDVAEDRLLAHLSLHFEPSEVGLLARCLCIPLVSIRVGKINKQGTLLSPIPIRGNLCLTLLPTSDLRISFNGDDGSTERLATLSNVPQCVDVEIEVISADKSGRSFVVKTSGCQVSYFWCSEKCTVLGNELLRKMNDLLVRKPSLAELTGITESRLNCFACHLRAYLTGSVVTSAPASRILLATPTDDSTGSSELHFPQSSINCQKSSRVRQYGIQGSKANLIYQGSLSPRSSSFKESLQKNFSIRSSAREKLRRRGENYVETLSLASSNSVTPSSPNNSFMKDKLPAVSESHAFAALSFLDNVFGKSAELPVSGSGIEVSLSVPSPLSPHYCWCPPVASALQYDAKGNPQLSISPSESFSLPPLSSLLSSGGASSLLTSKPLLNLSDVPPLDFPSFLPDPLVRLPTSQQIPTFTPFICDPIVHIPVIDVCSSGQGYLVSAGPAISTSIPPLNPNLVDPLLPNTESVVEKGARETLRMLISSSNQPQLLEVFPSVLSSKKEMQNVFAVGSSGFYSGTRDVVTNGMSAMGLVLLSEKSMRGGIGKKCAGRDDFTDHKEKSSSCDPSGVDEGIDFDR